MLASLNPLVNLGSFDVNAPVAANRAEFPAFHQLPDGARASPNPLPGLAQAEELPRRSLWLKPRNNTVSKRVQQTIEVKGCLCLPWFANQGEAGGWGHRCIISMHSADK